MLNYYVVVFLIGICSLLTLNMKDICKRNKIVIIFSSMLIILIQGLRRITVGVDLSAYMPGLILGRNMNFFAGDRLFNFELGYSIYSQFFAKINASEQVYLFIVAMTIILPIAYVWIKNSKMPGVSVFIYITMGFFTFSFSGLRQSIAIAIVFFSFKYIQKKSLIKFIVCIVLAMTFHSSAVVFIAAYPIYYLRLKLIYFPVIITVLIFTFIFRTKIYLLMYSLYKNVEGQAENINAYTMFFVMIFVLAISYIFGSKDKKDSNFNAYKNYMLVAIFVQLFASQSNIIMRAGYYYYIFITLLIPEVIKNQQDKKIRMIAVGVLIVALLYFFQLNTGGGYLDVSPYYFYWE